MTLQRKDNEPLLKLVESLCLLPGVGQRTARRMAYHLLQHDRKGAQELINSLGSALGELRHCSMCNNYTVNDICDICSDPSRDRSQLCVVETPADLNMVENSHVYNGLYYVLMGRLAPLEKMDANKIALQSMLDRALDDQVKEVIVATNYTAEGETTAHYVSELLGSKGIKVSRIARGVPAGSELEYVDASTLAWALSERR